jgi:tetratricopeptide (TPR) repeat protein
MRPAAWPYRVLARKTNSSVGLSLAPSGSSLTPLNSGFASLVTSRRNEYEPRRRRVSRMNLGCLYFSRGANPHDLSTFCMVDPECPTQHFRAVSRRRCRAQPPASGRRTSTGCDVADGSRLASHEWIGVSSILARPKLRPGSDSDARHLILSWQMDATRHRVVHEAISVTPAHAPALTSAEHLEQQGTWYLAGEAYRNLATILAGAVAVEDRARVLARAASCFDISGQSRPAARAYFDAASLLHNSKTRIQTAGELFNRAALLFRSLGEFFNAGDSWRRAGLAFSELPLGTVTSQDNLQPVPAAAGNFTISGNCYVAGGDAFSLAGDNAKWACMAYWEGGRAHSRQGYGFPAFEAYRKALLASIQFYGTHEPQEMRRYLPLTDAERAAKLDPLRVMEGEAHRSNRDHQRMNSGMLSPTWSELATHRQIAAAFHEFYLACVAVGNLREAARYRAATKERQRKIHLGTGRRGAATLYWLWRVTSGYGESLLQWVASTVVVLSAFAILYSSLGLIAPCSDWIDPFYFSVVTFTTLGYGDLHPVGILGKLLASAESMSGLIMFGLLLTFIGNRVQRT